VREHLRMAEWDVGVVFGRGDGPYADAIRSLGCEVFDLRMSGTGDLPRALRGVDHLRGFDIHHFHALEPCLMLASLRCNEAARVFTQRHGIYEPSEPLRKKARRALGGTILRRHFHAIAGNTQHAARYAVEFYRLQALPGYVTYNGIDFSLLTPMRSRMEVRRELGIGQNAFVVGSSGTFKGWKRFERLVALLGASPDLQVVLVGDGPRRDAFASEALSLKAGNRLHITGLVDNVADYLQAIDVFVLPSTAEESFGNSVVEAMALGVPSVVFADSPGICEHVESETTGFILDNPAALAPLVARLALNPDLRRRVGEAGAQRVRSKYTLDNMSASYRNLYNAAIAHRIGSHSTNGASLTGSSRDA
jgi:glycosyltransferase involved in cell wall biosynthesis